MPPKDLEKPDDPIIGEGIGVNIKIVAALCATLVAATGAFFSLRADVQSVQKDVSGLRLDIEALKKLSTLEFRVDTLQRNGSDSLREVKDQLQLTKEQLQALKERFDMHVATTSKPSTAP